MHAGVHAWSTVSSASQRYKSVINLPLGGRGGEAVQPLLNRLVVVQRFEGAHIELKVVVVNLSGHFSKSTKVSNKMLVVVAGF